MSILNDASRKEIQKAYSSFLESKQLKARYGQRLMIAEVSRTLGRINDASQQSPAICAIEAGTGTGKTVAYSVSAIPLARAAGKTLVVATATVALQEQIVLRDFPDLQKHSDLEFEYVLAKGRGRYVCLAKLDKMVASDSEPELALGFYQDDMQLMTAEAHATYHDMMTKLSGGEWEGDRDSWHSIVPDADWYTVTTDHAQCSGRRCQYINQCSYFKAREQWDSVDCIVTNHDLVLADLTLGGGAILPPPEDCIYIFDEGHQLPDKALNHFSLKLRLGTTINWLDQVNKAAAALQDEAVGEQSLERVVNKVLSGASVLHENLSLARVGFETFLADKIDPEGYAEKRRYRFEQGVVNSDIREQASVLAQRSQDLFSDLQRLADKLEDTLTPDSDELTRVDAELWFPVFSAMAKRAESGVALWRSYARAKEAETPPIARWIALQEGAVGEDIELAATPVLAEDILTEFLWNRCGGAVLTSATLTALGSFQRLIDRTGLPEDSHFAVMPTSFDYANAGLLQIDAQAEPTQVESHTARIVSRLPEWMAPKQGNLVLFSSRRQMMDVYDSLNDTMGEVILVQDHYPKHELLSLHRQAVDTEKTSVIFGLASFAEGIDLPGNYCAHLFIAKLPFSVPNDPVEEALAEWIKARGGNPFAEIAIPDAALRLIQATGRLLRHETDTGTITLFDNRAINKRYGSEILNSLPPYRREVVS